MCSKVSLIAFIGFLICVLHLKSVHSGATEEQMWATANLMREVCLPKYPKISKETADGIRAGNIPNDKDVKCYINCVMEMMQTIKKGKLLYESALKQVDLIMPDNFKDDYRNGITACKTSAVGIKDKCEAAYTLLVCLRSEISKFVFP